MGLAVPEIPAHAGVEARDVLLPAARYLMAARSDVSEFDPHGGQTPADDSRLDARLLLAVVLGRDEAVLPHETLADWSAAQADRFAALLLCRAAGEPVSRIRGWREFWSLRFDLVPDTLDPRADSETIVEAALAITASDRNAGHRFLDLGTGSGALLLACLSELPNASGVGVDISATAIQAARRNATKLNLDHRAEFHCADFGTDLSMLGIFDLVLCNPPYIPTSDIATLAPDVARYDPVRALDGGDDGLESWRMVLPTIGRHLAPAGEISAGRAVVEIGAGQADAVDQIALKAGLLPVKRHSDLSGEIRCLEYTLAPIASEKSQNM